MSQKILVVDDEAEICKILDKFLTKKGFHVLTATSGEEALASFKKERPDLVILDKKMPGIGGQAVLNDFKREAPSVPVIILTGSIDETSDKAAELGCDAILNKPVDLNVLLETVNRVLGK
jgi:DNA-binding response OmpR family regulator